MNVQYLTSKIPEHKFCISNFYTTNIESNSWNNSIRREAIKIWVYRLQLFQKSLQINQ